MNPHNPYVVERIVTIDADFTELCQATVMHYNTREEAIRGAQASIMSCYPWREGESWAYVRILIGRIDATTKPTPTPGVPMPISSDIVKYDFILARKSTTARGFRPGNVPTYRN